MITYRNMGEYVAAEPFRPFRIKMASGAAFEIRHPEMIVVGRTSAKVYTSIEGSEEGVRWHDVSLLLMETLEPLELAAPETVKGSQ
jgi:hypothetical protein